MFKLIDLGSDRIIGIRLEGKITADDFDAIAYVIEERLAQHSKLRVYAEIASFEGISVEAFFKDLQFTLRNWTRFDKEAVVTDQLWLQQTSEITGKLLPGIEVRAFPLIEKEHARQWVSA